MLRIRQEPRGLALPDEPRPYSDRIDDEVRQFMRVFHQFITQAMREVPTEGTEPLRPLLDGHLGVAANQVAAVAETIPPHRFADTDIEIPLPDRTARLRLLQLYARALELSEEVLDRTAVESEGTTASFSKELVRRCALRAAEEDRDPQDADLGAALAELLGDGEALTRALLGSARAVADHGPVSP